MSNNIKQCLNYISQNKYGLAEKAVNIELNKRVKTAFDKKQTEIASKFFSGKK